jgi:hypothetical protein
VSNLSGVKAIAAGYCHGLALKEDGTVWAWGDNSQGELGNGTTTSSKWPVKVHNLSGVKAIAGDTHSLALKEDGTVWAWGENAFGELGNGTTTTTGCYCSKVPVGVSNLSGVKAIAAGPGFSLALKTDGTVSAWGWNGLGQLGNGSTTSSTTPVRVSNLGNVKAIAARGYQSLAKVLVPPSVCCAAYPADNAGVG